MKISIIGTGYVGLVTGACFAESGHDVICVDNNADKVAAINEGKSPIHEAGLDSLLQSHIGGGLIATTDLKKAVLDSEITFIAVGTPFDGQQIDLSFIETVSRQIGNVLRDKDDYHTVAVKSTVVPGTTDGIVRQCLESESGKVAGEHFGLGMNPEFLTEGQAVDDFMHPDRIVIGGIDDASRKVLHAVYDSYADVPIIPTNNKTAEMIKYASNALLATMISFSNEIAALCSEIGEIDALEVMEGVHHSAYLTVRPRNGQPQQAGITSFLRAGCGFGGSCLPKDVKALAAQGEKLGLSMPMLNSVMETNGGQPQKLVDLMHRHLDDLAGVNVTVLGLSFKPDTNDVRESPAFPVIRILAAQGAVITAYDPVASEEAQEQLPDIDLHYAASLAEAVEDAAVICITTAWDEFRRLPEHISGKDSPPLIVDGRRIVDKTAVALYEGIGL